MSRLSLPARRRQSRQADKPLRDELLSIERLEERALALAASFTVDPRPHRRARDTFPRFEDNVRVLRGAYRTFTKDVETERFLPAAAEWFLDLAAEYVRVTGDTGVFDERIPYLAAPLLTADEHEAYGTPTASGQDGTLFEHCLRAIDRGITAGAHGLPLFGGGDWNDGMNASGHEGRGESTWLGFFLHGVLTDFAGLCDARGDGVRADTVSGRRAPARHPARAPWDGEWFRRGYYDDGTPLGSAQNDECRIDSISQTWAVLSGAVPRRFAERAMDAVRTALIAPPLPPPAAARSALRYLRPGAGVHQGISSRDP